MTVTLDLKPETEAKIVQNATLEGKAVAAYLEKIIEKTVEPEALATLPQTQIERNQAALAVLRQWREEDKTDDPEEIARRQTELDEFKTAMNESHTSSRIIYP